MSNYGVKITVSDDFSVLAMEGNKVAGIYAALKILAVESCTEEEMKDGKLPVTEEVHKFVKFAADVFQENILDDINNGKVIDEAFNKA